MYTHNEIFTHKETWNLAIYDNMNGHAKWNKLEKDKYVMISLIGGI